MLFFNDFTFAVLVFFIICAIISGAGAIQSVMPVFEVIVVTTVAVSALRYFINSLKNDRAKGCGPIASVISSCLAITSTVVTFTDFCSYDDGILGAISFILSAVFSGALLLWTLYGWVGANATTVNDPVEIWKNFIVEMIGTVILLITCL